MKKKKFIYYYNDNQNDNQITNDFLKMFGSSSPSISVSNAFSTVSTTNAFLSDMEAAILRSSDAPIQINGLIFIIKFKN